MDSTVVRTEVGLVEGFYRTNLDDKPFLCFLGIPYAKPPLGELRFKAPLPVEPWIGVRDATRDGNICPQTGETEGSEDCLNLNVYTKEADPRNSNLKPVMVWFHGGAYRFGSNKIDTAGPEFLMIEDIVLVMVHYRLGALGFLSLEDTSLGVPGNAGLKDQAMALRWIKKNISNFGGDPNNVTIFGESAGSAAVHLHILSKHSKGLFHKAIMQSGVALNPAGFADRQRAIEFIDFVKENEVKTDREVLDLLQDIPVEELLEKQQMYLESNNYADGLMGPILEEPNDTEFITQPVIDLLISGEYNKVPIMMGYCSNEGLIVEFSWRMLQKSGKSVPKIKVTLESSIPREMNLEKESPIRKRICEELDNLYFKGKNVDTQFLLPSDYLFIAGITGCAKIHAKTSPHPVFLYRISLDAGLNHIKRISKLDDFPGACHADDLGYLFKMPMDDGMYMGELEELSVRRFVKLWTNFAKYGDPTPKGNNLNIRWSPIEGDTLHILDIDKELSTHIDPEAERMKVWKEIYQLSPVTKNYL